MIATDQAASYSRPGVAPRSDPATPARPRAESEQPISAHNARWPRPPPRPPSASNHQPAPARPTTAGRSNW